MIRSTFLFFGLGFCEEHVETASILILLWSMWKKRKSTTKVTTCLDFERACGSKERTIVGIPYVLKNNTGSLPFVQSDCSICKWRSCGSLENQQSSLSFSTFRLGDDFEKRNSAEMYQCIEIDRSASIPGIRWKAYFVRPILDSRNDGAVWLQRMSGWSRAMVGIPNLWTSYSRKVVLCGSSEKVYECSMVPLIIKWA